MRYSLSHVMAGETVAQKEQGLLQVAQWGPGDLSGTRGSLIG